MAKQILTLECLKSKLHYNKDSGIFTRKISTSGVGRNIGAIAGSKAKGGYWKITINGNYCKAHRLAWFYVYGKWPEYDIDHINGVRSDNRICNLRDVPRVVNNQNRRNPNPSNKSGMLGVISPYGADKKFGSVIGVDGASIRLGRFDTPQEAHDCYLNAKREMHLGCVI